MSWVCGHVLGLCSFPGSWTVVMSWMGLWSFPGSVIISWLVVYGHILGGSVVIFWLRNHFLGRRLWSCPGSVVIFWVCVHFLDGGLWSCLGSVVITLVCGNFLALGLWSYPGWICHHFLNLWSFSGSWAVVTSFIGLWPCTMPASRAMGGLRKSKDNKRNRRDPTLILRIPDWHDWHSRTSSARHQEIADFREKIKGVGL